MGELGQQVWGCQWRLEEPELQELGLFRDRFHACSDGCFEDWAC